PPLVLDVDLWLLEYAATGVFQASLTEGRSRPGPCPYLPWEPGNAGTPRRPRPQSPLPRGRVEQVESSPWRSGAVCVCAGGSAPLISEPGCIPDPHGDFLLLLLAVSSVTRPLPGLGRGGAREKR